MFKCLTSIVSMRKEEFKYLNPTSTNTEAFCDKISYLTDCVCGNYQVRDNIDVVGERARTVLPCDEWIPLAPHNDGGSLSPACKVSPLDSTWLSMCRSSTCDPLLGSHVRRKSLNILTLLQLTRGLL
ncbi:unnamed protein product [Malus baccata var. baccata]